MSRLAPCLLLASIACGGEPEPVPAPEPAPSHVGDEAPHEAEPTPPPADARTACTSASECVLYSDACGWPAAAHITNVDQARAQADALRCCVACAAPPPGSAHAECVAGSCTAVRDLPAAAGS